MSRSRIHHGLALASAATLVSLSGGAVVGAAVADPGTTHENHGKHLGQVKDHAQGEEAGKQGHHGDPHGVSHGAGQQSSHAHENGAGHETGASHADPPGNNGTVKIAAPGDAVGQPSNNPHPGCTLFVEWFGFDQGQDVVSTVDFAAQAPTSDVTIAGTSPSQVFVGGDSAGGGTDLDGRQAYTLTFSGGEPHPKQGYHVKLTVATPYSQGNDTKSKVFWVAPCAAATTGATSQHATSQHGTGPGHSQAPGDRGVEAATAEAPTTVARAGSAPSGTAAVPTSVDAGKNQSVISDLSDWSRSPLPLAVLAGGLALVAVGLVRRNRPRA